MKWLLDNGDFSRISLKAIPEGRVIHAGVPVTVAEGPLAMAQILETPLLNHLNYPILVATKAARLRESAGDQLILDFGLRYFVEIIRTGHSGRAMLFIARSGIQENQTC